MPKFHSVSALVDPNRFVHARIMRDGAITYRRVVAWAVEGAQQERVVGLISAVSPAGMLIAEDVPGFERYSLRFDPLSVLTVLTDQQMKDYMTAEGVSPAEARHRVSDEVIREFTKVLAGRAIDVVKDASPVPPPPG